MLGATEARYFAKLLGGELRIGLKEAQVEEAVARGFHCPLSAVRHANLLRGDVGEVALLARHDALSHATLALFHPLGFMLAQPLATSDEIVAAMPTPFAVEDKYDGIRAQAHIDGDEVRLYSRTLDDISHGYPDVLAALRGLGEGLVLDGELLAVDPADLRQSRPFSSLQRRLGRKTLSEAMMAEVPVSFVGYDILARDAVADCWHVRLDIWRRTTTCLAAKIAARPARLHAANAILWPVANSSMSSSAIPRGTS